MTTREHGTIVITGGASGIGAATAHDMVAAGAHVALLDINAGLAQQTAEALGPKTSYYEVDATDEAAVAAVGEQIAASGYPTFDGSRCLSRPGTARACHRRHARQRIFAHS